MLILEGLDVDVISPFPAAWWPQAARWLHAQRTMVWGDGAPQDEAGIAGFLAERATVPGIETYGVVDRENLTGQRSEHPLVGVIFFEPAGRYNAYAHVASARRAWGNRLVQHGMIEQASEAVIQHVFAQHADLQRLSLAVFAQNRAAQNLARRMGFTQDGFFRAAERWRGEPMDVVHFGRLRPVSTEREQPLLVDKAAEQPVEA